MTSLSSTYLSSVGRIWSFVRSAGPGVLGMAVSLSPLDGSKNLGARSPAPTRPLIGIRDLIISLDNVGEAVRGTVSDDEPAGVTVPQIWGGVDIGKEHHHCVVPDAQGERLLSRRVLADLDRT